MTDREKVVEAMARAAFEVGDFEGSWVCKCADEDDADLVRAYREEAAAALAAAEAAGMRFVGAGEAVVPRVPTPEMVLEIRLSSTPRRAWINAVAEAEKGQ